MTLKALSVQPCRVTGWISSNIVTRITKVLVKKENVFWSSSSVGLETAESLMNKWRFCQQLGHSGWLPDWGLGDFKELFRILQWLVHIMTSCGHRSPSFSGSWLAPWRSSLWHFTDVNWATCEVCLLASHNTGSRSGSGCSPVGCWAGEGEGRQLSLCYVITTDS